MLFSLAIRNSFISKIMTVVVISLVVFAVIIILIVVLTKIISSPFHFPYFHHIFDASGKRKPQMDDFIDEFFIQGGFKDIIRHQNLIEEWKKESIESIEKIKIKAIKKLRQKQYDQSLDDLAFVFTITRQQKRHRQVNYTKYSYSVDAEIDKKMFTYSELSIRNEELAEIGYECTLSAYQSKEQRKLMTKELRKTIMERDNYTCQQCGKEMFDEVGLHIDHIIPVSKGGKTVPSNLQVLCSKCNGKKSNKI